MPTHVRLLAGSCLLLLGACADPPTAAPGPVPDSGERRSPLLDALQGRVKGVQLSGGGGERRARGYTIDGSIALIVLNGRVLGRGDSAAARLTGVDPRVTSLVVLTGPAAMARFGDEGRHSVLLLTTRPDSTTSPP